MIGGYLNAKANWTPVTKVLQTGEVSDGATVEIDCQVVDDVRIFSATAGRDDAEGIWSVLITSVSNAIAPGDKIQVTKVRSESVTRPVRIVRSSNIVGGFSASHREVLI